MWAWCESRMGWREKIEKLCEGGREEGIRILNIFGKYTMLNKFAIVSFFAIVLFRCIFFRFSLFAANRC